MTTDFSIDPKFSDPILLPRDAPIPANIKHFRLVSRGEFEEAEMAAFDELPKSLRNIFQRHSVDAIYQLLLKGLRFGEFTEDQVAMAALMRIRPTEFKEDDLKRRPFIRPR